MAFWFNIIQKDRERIKTPGILLDSSIYKYNIKTAETTLLLSFRYRQFVIYVSCVLSTVAYSRSLLCLCFLIRYYSIDSCVTAIVLLIRQQCLNAFTYTFSPVRIRVLVYYYVHIFYYFCTY